MPEDIIQIFKADIVDLQKKAKDVADNLDKIDKKGKKTTKSLKAGFFDVNKQVDRLGKRLIAAFAIQRIVSTTLKILASFEQQMDKVASITGATDAEMVQLSASAKTLGATTAFTATQVGQLQEEYAKLGFSTQEILDATKATLDLAAATKSDLAVAATVAGATVRGFSLDASETQRVVDVMAQAFRSSALDLSKFQTAMATVAPVAADAGATLEETTALLGLLADRGLDASVAGTSLRNIFLTLSERGITFNQAMERINSSTDKSGESLVLFGKRGAIAGSIIAQNADQVAALTGKLNIAQGVAQEMADKQLANLSGRVTILGSAWEGFILSLDDGNGFLSTFLKGAVEAGTAVLNLLTGTEDLTEELINQQDALDKEAEELTKLADRYDELAIKTELSAAEQEEQNALIIKITGLVPEAASEWDEYNKVIGINTEALRGNIERQQEILRLKFKEQIAEVRVNLDLQNRTLEASEANFQKYIDRTTEVARTSGQGAKSTALWNEVLLDQRRQIAESQLELSKLGVELTDAEKGFIDATLGVNLFAKAAEDAADAEGDLDETEIALIKTIKSLRQEQTELRDERDKLEIGSVRFLEVSQQLKDITDELTVAQGKETEAMKEARKERETAEKKAIKAAEDAAKKEKKLAEDRLKAITKRTEAENEFRDQVIFNAKSLLDQEDELFNDRLREAGIFGKDRAALTERDKEVLEALEEDHAAKVIEIEEDTAAKKKKIRDKELADQKQQNAELLQAIQDIANTFIDIFDELAQRRLDKQLTNLERAEKSQLDSIQKQVDQELITREQGEVLQDNITEDFQTKRAAILTKQAKKDRTAALFRATIDGIAAVIKAGVVTPLGIATAIANAAQIALIATRPIPEFAKGVVDYQGKGSETSDSNLVKISKRESILTANATKAYGPELEAANSMRLDKFIQDNYITPALMGAVEKIESNKQASFANNIANSLNLMGKIDPSTMHDIGRRNSSDSQRNAKTIVDGVSRATKDLAHSLRVDERRKL